MSGNWADVVHNVLAIRAAPEGGSEQVSQAIMGDAVQILSESDGYAHVRCADGYEGWALRNQLRAVPDEAGFVAQYSDSPDLAVVWEAFAEVTSTEGEPCTKLVFGTPILVHDYDPKRSGFALAMLADGTSVRIDAHTLRPFRNATGSDSPASLARRFVGTPYLWGGATPFGFDCSGFVQRVYTAVGVSLPRDAYQQAACPLGQIVPAGAPLLAGDLVFFLGARDPRNRGITHVGMMIDPVRMIHAHGRRGVTIEPLISADILAAYAFKGALRLK